MGTSQPVCSFICPTGDRAILLSRALLYMQEQDLAEPFEVVIVDGGRRPAPLELGNDNRTWIKCVRVDPSTSIGERRNVACENARGQYIIHFDDDWYSRSYARRTLEALRAGGELTSVQLTWAYYPTKQRGWKINYQPGGNWGGNALGYRRHLWEKVRFPPIQKGEDRAFIDTIAAQGHKLDHFENSEELVVHLRHRFNVTGPTEPIIDPVQTEKVRSILGPDVAFYDDLAELAGEAQRAAEIGPGWFLPKNQRSF